MNITRRSDEEIAAKIREATLVLNGIIATAALIGLRVEFKQ